MADGFSEWLPVISTLSGGVLAFGAALMVNKVSHHYALEREILAAKERQRHERQLANDIKQKELYFIGTELVCLLEQYAEGCTQVAIDGGWNVAPVQSEAEARADYPELNLTDVSGDWRVLDLRHMYRIRELPVLQNEARRAITYAAEIPAPPWHEDYFRERQYQFARLGIRAVIMSVRLRRAIGLPGTRLTGHDEWSAVARLWKVWRRERHRRADEAASNRKLNQPVIPRHDDGEPAS